MEPYLLLERRLADWVGCHPKQMVVCSSGTAALHLALEAVRPGMGTHILIPDYTMVSCARACSLAGLYPVLVDCRPTDLLMDPELIVKGVEGVSESSIMAVHIYGRRCDMNVVAETGRRFGMAVIEDMAEIHGVTPHPHTDAACWSFYRNKIVGGEEGGAVAFGNLDHASAARELRCVGFTDQHDFIHTPRGHNYRMANCLAVKVMESLSEFSYNVAERRRVEELYDKHCPPTWRQPERMSPWVYDVRVPGMSMRYLNRIVSAFNKVGLSVRHGFKPMSWQTEYCGCRRSRDTNLPESNADVAAREVFYLPLSLPPGVGEAFVKWVFEAVSEGLRMVPKSPP